MPKTKLGKWAGLFLAIYLVSLIVLIIFVNVLDFKPGTALAITPGVIMMASGIASFITGLISLLKFKDRSFTVILAVVLGLLAVLMVLMEVGEALSVRNPANRDPLGHSL